jgi:hypothetical protein
MIGELSVMPAKSYIVVPTYPGDSLRNAFEALRVQLMLRNAANYKLKVNRVTTPHPDELRDRDLDENDETYTVYGMASDMCAWFNFLATERIFTGSVDLDFPPAADKNTEKNWQGAIQCLLNDDTFVFVVVCDQEQWDHGIMS